MHCLLVCSFDLKVWFSREKDGKIQNMEHISKKIHCRLYILNRHNKDKIEQELKKKKKVKLRSGQLMDQDGLLKEYQFSKKGSGDQCEKERQPMFEMGTQSSFISSTRCDLCGLQSSCQKDPHMRARTRGKELHRKLNGMWRGGIFT